MLLADLAIAPEEAELFRGELETALKALLEASDLSEFLTDGETDYLSGPMLRVSRQYDRGALVRDVASSIARSLRHSG